MNYPIIKSFVKDKTVQQVEYEAGTTNFASWHRLLPYLREACGLRENEEIIGIRGDDMGITIVIRLKTSN